MLSNFLLTDLLNQNYFYFLYVFHINKCFPFVCLAESKAKLGSDIADFLDQRAVVQGVVLQFIL